MIYVYKRKTVFAYALTCSSISIALVVWVFLFIASPPVTNDDDRRSWRGESNMVKRSYDENVPRDSKHLEVIHMHKDAKETYGNVKLDLSTPIIIPNNTQLRLLSWSQLSILYHRYLSENQYKCQNTERRGRITDGGWDVCDDAVFKPKSPCIVYSFGIGDDFSFDDAMSGQYGCHVYSFDPSMRMKSVQRNALSFFYKQGLADSDRILPNGWVMGRIESIRTGLKHGKKHIHTVKLDIEEWEWEVLPDLLTSDFLLSVTQLLVEFHQCDGCSKYNPAQEDKEPSRDRYIHMLELLAQLYRMKFRIFHHHHNRACNYVSKFTLEETSACTEIGFVRVL